MNGSTNAQPNTKMCIWLSHASFAVEAGDPHGTSFTTVPIAYNCTASLDNELISVSGSSITVKKSGLYRIYYHPLFGSWSGSGYATAYGGTIVVNNVSQSVTQITSTDQYTTAPVDIELPLSAGDVIKAVTISSVKTTLFGYHTGETGMWWDPSGYISITYYGGA